MRYGEGVTGNPVNNQPMLGGSVRNVIAVIVVIAVRRKENVVRGHNRRHKRRSSVIRDSCLLRGPKKG
jgi:hypothetical protein